jgi:hypothetical protein
MSTVSTPLPFTPAQMNAAQTSQWKQHLKGELADLRCATPAFLSDDMNTNQTVNVQIATNERIKTTAGAKWVAIPPIYNVPVVLPRGGGFSLTTPLKKGNEGLLVFCDVCFDLWWTRGGLQNQLEVRRHDVTDCGFLPGMWSQPNVLSNYSTTSMQLRTDDGSALVDVAEGAVSVLAQGGVALPLMNNIFYQWFLLNIIPFLAAKGYAGPPVPVGAETTILKGQ